MRFIKHLILKKQINVPDQLELVIYLLLQERVTQAIEVFEKIKIGERDDAQLQYDYLKAYLDFYQCGQRESREFKEARRISHQYLDYPVHHWRVLFTAIADQIQEIDEINNPVVAAQIVIDNFEDTEQQRRKKQVSTEPQLEIYLSESHITIDCLNTPVVTLSYYPIDLETLFSHNPFFFSATDSANLDNFSFVLPVLTEQLEITQPSTQHLIPITNANVLIEAAANGIKQYKTHFPSSQKHRVHLFENLGELKVTNESLPLPETYVKVYSKQRGGSGEVKFFKDGYTDMRGRFDYGQLSGTSIDNVEKFAVFIASEKWGSVVKECKPPHTLAKV
ncbi:hypothetical protein FGO68_gene2890 [Halteria grandinella]|uniref:Uncharacterized protein n=1 Tax=Halteria grandinella TaxID=5974 RepID=A0A8J8SWC5_HALGN|nr:hypothetical protein FGO68_gene2890 [Halteria grandinella]